MKVIVFYKTFSGNEFLEASIKSVIDHVDRVVIFNSQESWAGVGKNNVTLTLNRLAAEYDKIDLHNFDSQDQMAQYHQGLLYVNQYKPDWIFYVDADEIWDKEMIQKAFKYLESTSYDALKCKVMTYVKSVFFRVEPVEELEPVVFVRGGLKDYGSKIRSCNMKNLGVMVDVYFHHFTYVRESFEEILVKLLNSHYSEGQPTEPLDFWINEKWHKLPECRSFHPAMGFQNNWLNAKKITEGALPHTLTHPMQKIVKLCKGVESLKLPPNLLTESDRSLLFDFAQEKDLIVDLGTYKGGSAKIFAYWARDVHTIDCYDLANKINIIGEKDANFKDVDAEIGPIPNLNLHKAVSWESASKFEDNSIDLVFIDACHMYEEVKKDCMAYKPKVKPGALFLFHDCNTLHPEVIRAVKDLERWNNDLAYYPTSHKYMGTSIAVLRKQW